MNSSNNNMEILLQMSTAQVQSSANLNKFFHYCSQNNILSPNIIKSAFKYFNVPNAKWDMPKKTKNIFNHFTYQKFTEMEDIQLKFIVDCLGPKNWAMIASFIPYKTARQCRDRYKNYLAPGFIQSGWSEEEDIILVQKYLEIGPHWSKIQKFFPYRTSNSIKNRFNYSVKKKTKFKLKHTIINDK